MGRQPVYIAGTEVLPCDTPALERWHKQPYLEPVPPSPPPLRKTGKAASLNESTFAPCMTHCFGSQRWQKSSLHCVWVPPSTPVWQKIGLPVNSNAPVSLSHQRQGCHQPGRWWIADQVCMHKVPKDTLSLHRYQTLFWLEWEGRPRLVTFPPSLLAAATRSTGTEIGKSGVQKACRSSGVLWGGGASCSA